MGDLDVKYIAGLVDGEGHVSLSGQWVNRPYGRQRYWQTKPSFSICMDMRAAVLLSTFRDWAKSIGANVSYTIYSYKSNKGRTYCKVATTGLRSAAIICRALVPHLILKKANAEMIIQYADMRERASRKWNTKDLSLEMKLVSECKANNRAKAV